MGRTFEGSGRDVAESKVAQRRVDDSDVIQAKADIVKKVGEDPGLDIWQHHDRLFFVVFEQDFAQLGTEAGQEQAAGLDDAVVEAAQNLNIAESFGVPRVADQVLGLNFDLVRGCDGQTG